MPLAQPFLQLHTHVDRSVCLASAPESGVIPAPSSRRTPGSILTFAAYSPASDWYGLNVNGDVNSNRNRNRNRKIKMDPGVRRDPF